MNKRDFLKSILLGCAAPGLFLPRLSKPQWKRHGEIWQRVWTLNPEYVNARYEYAVIGADSGVIGYEGSEIILHDCLKQGRPLHRIFDDELKPQTRVWDPFYIRGNELNEKGEIVSIPPFIEERHLIA